MLQVFLLLSFPANFVNCSLCWFRYVSHHILIYYILIHPYCSCHCHHMGKIRRFGPPWSLKVIFGCPLLISLSYTHKINILSSLSNWPIQNTHRQIHLTFVPLLYMIFHTQPYFKPPYFTLATIETIECWNRILKLSLWIFKLTHCPSFQS